jgi:hypothetical protein
MYQFQIMVVFEFPNSNHQKFQNLLWNFYFSYDHNFGVSNSYSMEADCQEYSFSNMALVEEVDVTKLFAALSSQMTPQNNSLQEQFMQNDL